MVEVKERFKRKNQILFTESSECLQELAKLLKEQNRRVIALWAFDLAAQSVEKLKEKYPDETRPQKALFAVKDWAAGNIKMPDAKRRILDCHAFAKEITDKADIAICHAVGQACSVVHTVGHAMGYPIYDLTSFVYQYGIDNCTKRVENRISEYIGLLQYWQVNESCYSGKWAQFMMK